MELPIYLVLIHNDLVLMHNDLFLIHNYFKHSRIFSKSSTSVFHTFIICSIIIVHFVEYDLNVKNQMQSSQF